MQATSPTPPIDPQSQAARLDAEMEPRNVLEQVMDFLLDPARLTQFALGILAALLILVIGWGLAKFLRRRLSSGGPLSRRINPTLRPVVASAAYYIVIALTLFAVLVQIGVPAASLIAVFGAAGLAVGLALKDTLGNVASGIMLLSLRPLDIDEYIATPDFEGTVNEIGLFATTLTNREGVAIFVPNAKVWDARIINYGRLATRKFIVDIGVGYGTDLRKAIKLGIDTLTGHDYVVTEPKGPECYVEKFGDSAIGLSFRGHVENSDYLDKASELRTSLKEALDEAGVEIPFPQRVVTQKAG